MSITQPHVWLRATRRGRGITGWTDRGGEGKTRREGGKEDVGDIFRGQGDGDDTGPRPFTHNHHYPQRESGEDLNTPSPRLHRAPRVHFTPCKV